MPDWVSLAGIVTLGVGFIAGLAKAARWSGQVDSDRDVFKQFIERVEKRFEKVDERFEKVDEKLEAIFDRLPPRLVARSSPFRLTDLGEQAAKQMSAYGWAAELAPRLLGQVKGFAEFEIYEFCSAHVNGLDDQEVQRNVAACAYDLGTDKDSVFGVLTVVLRDELLRLLGRSRTSS